MGTFLFIKLKENDFIKIVVCNADFLKSEGLHCFTSMLSSKIFLASFKISASFSRFCFIYVRHYFE